MPLRAIALSGKYHKFDKALFGSYRDHVPSHYELGYQLVCWTRERYGANVFEPIVNYVARRPYLSILYPFKIGLKKETGYRTELLYRNAFDDLTRRWGEQEVKTGYDDVVPLNCRKNSLYASYRSPRYLNDSAVVAQKTGIAQITQLVMVDANGREQKLHTPGFVNSERISCSGGLLAWSEQIQDARWANRSYSVVKLFDLKTGKERTLKRRTRYFSPALSPDGLTVAVVDAPAEGSCSIVLLDAATGEEKDRLPNPDEALLQTPSWCADGKNILAVANGAGGKSIVRIDIATGRCTPVLPPSRDDISCPADGGKYVYFTAYRNGITNIYAVDYRAGKVMQVTSARFGAFDPQPCAARNRLVYSEYSANGYNIIETEIDTAKWTAAEYLTDYSTKLYATIARQENFNMQDSVIPDVRHAIKPYRKWANLFNVHSWAPLYYSVDASDAASTEFYPGAVLLSQDLTGNLTSSAGYSWRGYNAFHASFTFKGLYPVIDFRIDYGGQVATLGPSGSEANTDNLQRRDAKFSVRAYIPYELTRSRWITGIIPQVQFSYKNSYIYNPATDNYRYGLRDAVYSLQAYRYLKMSMRDLAPRLGFAAQGAFMHTPWNTEQLGNIWYVYGRAYLPGIGRHHSLQASGAWQQQQAEYFLFSSLLKFPRGYIKERTEKLVIGTIDYSLPLFYPDWNWAFFAYLKRIRANLFCDAALNSYRVTYRNANRSRWQNDRLLSAGVDLLADVILLRINFPVNMGMRTVYVPETKEVQPSLLFQISFN
jgi:hypothetical protein